MPEPAAELAALALSLAFAAAAMSKLTAHHRWRSALRAYRLPSRLEDLAARGVPVAEAALAILLVINGRLAALAAGAMLVVFSLAVVRAHSLTGDRLPCGCFGGHRSPRDWRLILARNSLLAGLIGVVLVSGDATALEAVELSRGEDLFPLLLAAGGLLIGAWMVRSAVAAFREPDSM